MTKGKRYHGINRYLLVNGRYPMTSYQILERLQKAGHPVKPGAPIPRDADFVANIGGVRIHVRPKQRKGMEKRVYAECPECYEWYEAGHLHQHVEARHA